MKSGGLKNMIKKVSLTLRIMIVANTLIYIWTTKNFFPA
jgi:hypothetical protein